MKLNTLFLLAATSSVLADTIKENMTNSTNLQSFFTYDESMKYFEDFKCNSVNDCPKGSHCIGNKCITSFYCKDGDMSNCSFYLNICDGKPCYKFNDRCDKNEDCLGNYCSEGICRQSYSYEKYSTGLFSYQDAKRYFEKIDIDCHSYTYEYKYSKCKDRFFCKRNKSVCSFVMDVDKKIVYATVISKKGITFGLEEGSGGICRYDGECLSGLECLWKDFYGRGSCEQRSESNQMEGIGFVFLFIGLSIVLFFIFVCLCCSYFTQEDENNIREKNNLNRVSIFNSEKLLVKMAIGVTVLIIFFAALLGLNSHLNKKSIESLDKIYSVSKYIIIIVCIALVICICYSFYRLFHKKNNEDDHELKSLKENSSSEEITNTNNVE